MARIGAVSTVSFVLLVFAGSQIHRRHSRIPEGLRLTGLTSNKLVAVSSTALMRVLSLLWLMVVGFPAPGGASLSFSNVFIVAEENHNYSEVVGNSSMPYLNSLIADYGLATGYFANTHPSLPNYLWLTSGGNDGITRDECYKTSGPLNVDNAVRDLRAAGVSWRAYMENLPAVGFLGCQSGDRLYVTKHDPFVYYSDVLNSLRQQQNIVPFFRFGSDINGNILARYNFISPNLCHDLHSDPSCANGCIDPSLSACYRAADNWLSRHIRRLLNRPMFQPGGQGLLVITFDEGTDNANSGGQVATVLIGPQVKAGYRSRTFYQHQSLLRLMLEGLGVRHLPQSAITAPDMAEFFRPS